MFLVWTVLATSRAAASDWPFLKHYDQSHLSRIALPIGGIGTGTFSLGGRGDLRDWEIVNRPAKGFSPGPAMFLLRVEKPDGKSITRLLQGPVDQSEYEGAGGARASANPGLPRFSECSFDAGYPFGQVTLTDRAVPVRVRLRAFNPLVPTDPEASGIPIAILRYEISNTSPHNLKVSVCGTIQNFIGNDGTKTLAKDNVNVFRRSPLIDGILMTSSGVDSAAEQWGSMVLSVPAGDSVSYRTRWLPQRWGTALLDFWDDFSEDGLLTERSSTSKTPWGSLAVTRTLPAHATCTVTFYLSWHFPNRFAWSEVVVGNHYATRFADAWDVVERTVPDLPRLEEETLKFTRAFCLCDLPPVVKEAALFNLSTLRSQTCFRTADGRFFAWEGCSDQEGCCWGSCTHVWNYEQAIAFLFGSLATAMRRVEFGTATDSIGLMSFRVRLPLDKEAWGKAAADGQMGCIMKMYRDWQMSGDRDLLRTLWPRVRSALEFCWIPGGWDADTNGVMEGCQHNTMDVEYYGPNAQMQIWYLGALRAAALMAADQHDTAFAALCSRLFHSGKGWTDTHLFNGRYYRQIIIPPMDTTRVAKSLIVGMGATDLKNPDYQLGDACLVDQLVGQYMAHICDLGYLVNPDHVRSTLRSIMRYNYRPSLTDHFNCMRTFALGDEAALLMAAYPEGRPANPFPYFSEVMTGFEYTAAIGMLYEGDRKNGLRCFKSVRDRYDGAKRNPYDEAECGHHYGRAMASWGAVPAITGFHYSAVDRALTVGNFTGTQFWSNGYAYGTMALAGSGRDRQLHLRVIKGKLRLRTLSVRGSGTAAMNGERTVHEGQSFTVAIPAHR